MKRCVNSQRRVQERIREYIIENILFGDGEQLSVDTSLQESGVLDSTGVLEIITFVEEEFGIQIEDDEVVPENFETLNKMSEYVQIKLSTNAVT